MLAEQKAGGYSTKYRFTGKEVDEETGHYYFGARYYDPRISLWYGVDPKAEDGLDYSPYIYTFNNPILFVDPNGEWPTPAEIKAFGKGMVKGAVIGVVGGLAVGALIASGGTAAPAIGYALAAYGTYEAGKSTYEIASGTEAYSGRALSSEERFEKGGELVGGLVGGGLGFKGVKGISKAGPAEKFFSARDNNFTGSLANRLGPGRVKAVEQDYSFTDSKGARQSGDIDLVGNRNNVEVKSGGKMDLTQSLKNKEYSSSQGKGYYLFMPKATGAQIRDAARKGITVIKDEANLKSILE